MLRIPLAVILLLSTATAESFGAEALKKIRIASKAAGESLVPYLVSQRLGFYREEGLDVDVIVTRGTVTTQVVVSGAVEYGNGGSIPAMLGGARFGQFDTAVSRAIGQKRRRRGDGANARSRRAVGAIRRAAVRHGRRDDDHHRQRSVSTSERVSHSALQR